MLQGLHIVLGITGGIAAYKSALLTRLLVKAGAEVQVVMTPAAKEFITPLTLSTLSGRPVISQFFTANTGEWHSHVALGEWADAMIIAPATACTLGKMASGVADNMLVTTYLSARSPVFVAPAMDLDMMAHPTTTRNLETLRHDGVHIIEPATGELASHLTGRGRMAEPDDILKAIDSHFSQSQDLAGQHVLITAGPTHEPIDPVRYIGNCSSGKMGYALAQEAAARGALVTLVSGPVSLTAKHPHITVIPVVTAQEMLQAAQRAWPTADLGIMCAAVADYRPDHAETIKIKREHRPDAPVLTLVKNPDIAATLGAEKRPGQRLIGFALETDHALQNAQEKLRRKHLDMIVLNTLAEPGAGFATDTNRVTILMPDSAPSEFTLKAKSEVAKDIIDSILHLDP